MLAHVDDTAGRRALPLLYRALRRRRRRRPPELSDDGHSTRRSPAAVPPQSCRSPAAGLPQSRRSRTGSRRCAERRAMSIHRRPAFTGPGHGRFGHHAPEHGDPPCLSRGRRAAQSGDGPTNWDSTPATPTTTCRGRSFRDRPWFGAVPTLAAAAAATTHLRLGPLVTSPNFRHPVTLAKDLMSLDDISAGRLIVGIGAGGIGFDAEVLGEAPGHLGSGPTGSTSSSGCSTGC